MAGSGAIETSRNFTPKFDAAGLMPAIVTDAASGDVLMMAYVNAEALELTLRTRIAHFWSRSRQSIWKKGESSGNMLSVAEIRVDCDQDTLQFIVNVGGDGVACHTGARSCFYRQFDLGRPWSGDGVDALIPASLPDRSK